MATKKISPAAAESNPTNRVSVAGNSRQQSATTAGFDVAQFLAREQRRTARMVRAAWGVGGTHAWFRSAPRVEQVAKVREWLEEAQQRADERRAGLVAS